MILLEIEDRRIVISLSQGRKAKAYHGQMPPEYFCCPILIPLLLTKLVSRFLLDFAMLIC
jgi:hypothetical protein